MDVQKEVGPLLNSLELNHVDFKVNDHCILYFAWTKIMVNLVFEDRFNFIFLFLLKTNLDPTFSTRFRVDRRQFYIKGKGKAYPAHAC